jgi:hypothetical protein
MQPLYFLAATYLLGAMVFGSMNLDGDEFAFVREPYEMLGGDYTARYLREGEYKNAVSTAVRSYWFFWNYRPLFSPVVRARHKALFSAEERRFGYEKPTRLGAGEDKTLERYQSRLVVPEPDRFYSHGAGKPLLAAIANIPALALVALVTAGGPDLLSIQFKYDYHPIFIVVRLAPIVAGLATLILLYWLVERQWGRDRAILAGALFLSYPPTLLYFANIHHDAYMVPFVLGAAYAVSRERYVAAGIFLGLALAAKNTAVFLVPAILLFLVWKIVRQGSYTVETMRPVTLTSAANGAGVVALLAIVTLLPFANPVSYAQEILTPISGRPFDPRGENVAKYQLRSTGGSEVGEATTAELAIANRPAVQGTTAVLSRLIPWNVYLAFVVLAIVTIGPRIREDIVAVSFFFMLTMFPHSLLFGSGLNYRTLMFVPFFSVLATRFAGLWWGAVVVMVFATVIFLFALDPHAARNLL